MVPSCSIFIFFDESVIDRVFEYWEYGGDRGEDVAKPPSALRQSSCFRFSQLCALVELPEDLSDEEAPSENIAMLTHCNRLGVVHPECMDSVWKCQCTGFIFVDASQQS